VAKFPWTELTHERRSHLGWADGSSNCSDDPRPKGQPQCRHCNEWVLGGEALGGLKGVAGVEDPAVDDGKLPRRSPLGIGADALTRCQRRWCRLVQSTQPNASMQPTRHRTWPESCEPGCCRSCLEERGAGRKRSGRGPGCSVRRFDDRSPRRGRERNGRCGSTRTSQP
jgi:hypothetical protein